MAEVVAVSQTIDKSIDKDRISDSFNESSSDEAESKDSTLVDESSLTGAESTKSLSDCPDGDSKPKDDNANFPTSDCLDPQINTSLPATSQGDGLKQTHPKLTLSISKSESHHTSSSSLNSSLSASSHLMSTPARQSSPVVMGAEDGSVSLEPIPQMTSTPIILGTSQPGSNLAVPSTSRADRPQSLSVRLKTPDRSDSHPGSEDEVNTSFTSQTSTHTMTHESQTDLDLYDQLQAPIVGYETMEERARFTVFKIRVQKTHDDGWHIFRRYSDFVRLNDTLKQVFPHFRLALPPKRWLGDNYERRFLDDRLLGLQAFLNNVISHRDVCNSEPVREFLCVDDPPGAHDSLEESRAVCEMLEDQVYTLRQDLQTRDARVALLEEELALYKAEVENLRRALRVERALNTHRRCSPSSHSQRSENSITEHDEASEAEADQGHPHDKPSTTSSVMTSPEGVSTGSWDVISDGSHENNKQGRDVTATKVTSGPTSGPTSETTSLSVKTSELMTSSGTSETTSAVTSESTSLTAKTSELTTSSLTPMTCVPSVTSLTSAHPLGPTLTPEKLRSATVP